VVVEDELKEVGVAVRAYRGGCRGRLSCSLQTKVTDAARRARHVKISVQRIAELTGVSTQSIYRWTKAKKKTQLIPVRLAPMAVVPTLTVISPDGWRITGLDVHSAAALLRAAE